MSERTPRKIATVTMEIDVYLEVDPGINTPDAFEMSYEYLVVRDVRDIRTETFGATAPLQLVGFDGFPDHDPDDLIHSELGTALTAAVGDVRDGGQS